MAIKYKGFILRFHMENDAFTDTIDRALEIARILRDTANRIEAENITRGIIMDINGNSIGSFGVRHKEI